MSNVFKIYYNRLIWFYRSLKTEMARQFFVGGNFKLNPATLSAKDSLIEALNKAELDPSTGKWLIKMFGKEYDWLMGLKRCLEVVIAPPSLYVLPVLASIRKDIKVAAQNCYFKESGAFTGEIRYAAFFLLNCPFWNIFIALNNSLTPVFHTSFSVSETPIFMFSTKH